MALLSPVLMLALAGASRPGAESPGHSNRKGREAVPKLFLGGNMSPSQIS